MKKASTLALAMLLTLSGCATQPPPEHKLTMDKAQFDDASRRITVTAPPPPVEPPPATTETLAEPQDTRRFSFRAKNLPMTDAIALFARLYGLNIIAPPDLEGDVTVEFKDLSLDAAMTAILASRDYAWEKEDNLIRISRSQTRTYHIDYIRLTRGGQGSSQSSISNQTSSNNSGGGSSGNQGGSVSSQAATSAKITQQDKIEFWQELEAQLKLLLSKQGHLAINRLSGTIQVSDLPSRIRNISRYLENLDASIHRQVEIYVRILEVTLRNDSSLGIDWTKVVNDRTTLTASTIASGAIGGLSLKPATFTAANTSSNATALLEALEEQGDVKVISQPKIRSLNNQTAMIKVGTDLTFFTKHTTTITTNGIAETTVSEDPTTVTEGIVMSVTPQISADGWVMLDIAPIITRVTDTIVSDNGSTAPVLDIKQATALVRARSGEMVILGGLIQQQRAATRREVTGLGRLPLIGALFRSNYQADNTKEIVILLQPVVVKG